jgi:fumarylacetoacetase
MIDETHDAKRQSWVASANGHAEFPLQNLPFGVFSPPGHTAPDAAPRGGIAIGDMIFDIRAAHVAGLFSGAAVAAAEAASGITLNPLMALGSAPRRALRQQIFALLAARCGPHEGRAARRQAAASRRRLLAAPASDDRQLHRFLRRHSPRRQWRSPAGSEQPAEPEL